MKTLKIALLAACLALSGCWKPETDRTIALVGDSLMRTAGGVTSSQILIHDNAPIVIMNAIGGAPLGAIGYIEGRIKTTYDKILVDEVYIHLGINDMGSDFYTNQFPQNIDRLMSVILSCNPDAKVKWILPHKHVPRDNLDIVRQHIIDASFRYEALSVVHFEPGLDGLIWDDIHLNDRGNARFAKMIEQEVYK